MTTDFSTTGNTDPGSTEEQGPGRQRMPASGDSRPAGRSGLALVTDVITPHPDQDSGSMDTMYYIRMLQILGYRVVFCPYNLLHDGQYTIALQKLGVECLSAPYTRSLPQHLADSGYEYDLILLNRAQHVSGIIPEVRQLSGKAKLVFNTVDLHYLREQRQAELENSGELLEKSRESRERELGIMRRCDATIVISEAERQMIQEEDPGIRLFAIPYIREVIDPLPDFASRHDIVFIGGFGFEPNRDAALYFVNEIWPKVRNRLPGVSFLIIGSNMPETIIRLEENPGVEILGYVERLTPILKRCRLSVAPLRYGAGIKGKIGTSITHGVPCVVTSIAAEGMGLAPGENIMIADDETSFANAIFDAYTDSQLWNTLSRNGLEYFKANFSFARGLERFESLLNTIS